MNVGAFFISFCLSIYSAHKPYPAVHITAVDQCKIENLCYTIFIGTVEWHWWTTWTETEVTPGCGVAIETPWSFHSTWNFSSTRCSNVWTSRMFKNNDCKSSCYRE